MISKELKEAAQQEVVNAIRVLATTCDINANSLSAHGYNEEAFRSFIDVVQSSQRMLYAYAELESLPVNSKI